MASYARIFGSFQSGDCKSLKRTNLGKKRVDEFMAASRSGDFENGKGPAYFIFYGDNLWITCLLSQ
jgi:hypothetical protein